MFAYEHEDIKPDAITVGKAMSGGFYPVSSVLACRELLEVFNPGEHGSTFGGNPLACSVSSAAIDVLIEENLIENSKNLGKYFLNKLKGIKNPHIKEVRGKGLFLAIELDTPARPYTEALMKEGVLAKETHENIIRIAPPLVITQEEIDFALEKINKVFE